MDDKTPYDLDYLITKLENIRDGQGSNLNFPRAYYTLALEIKALKETVECLSRWQDQMDGLGD